MTARQRKTLDRLIDRFLAEKRKSDGGYAPVTEQDWSQLNEIIDTLVMLKWSPDPDGDWPIDWKLIDRTQYEPMHYHPVPYDHKTVAKLERLSTVAMNATIATDELNTSIRLLQLDLLKPTDAGIGRVEHERKR